MKSFLFAFLALVLFVAVVPCPAQQYDFRAPVKVEDLTIRGTVYIIADHETLSVFTADSLVKLVLAAGRITGTDVVVTDTIKGKKGIFTDSVKCPTVDATGKITGGAGLAITGAGAFTTRLTGTDVAVSDSIKGVTVDATGKITGGAGLGITGAGAFSTRITGSDIAVTDSVIGVTGDFSGIVSPLSVTLPGGGTIADPASPGTTVTITETNIALAGAVTATSVASGTAATAITWKVIGDSLAFITGTDTMWAWQPGTK